MTTIDFIRVYSIKELLRYARNTWQGLKKTKKRIVQTTQRLTADLFKEACPAVLLEGRDRDVQWVWVGEGGGLVNGAPGEVE